MSVVKSKRKPSQFEVFHHFSKLRKGVTLLLLNDFGYSVERARQNLDKSFGDNLTPEKQTHYEKRLTKIVAFAAWFIPKEKEAVTDCLREITACLYGANSIYPMYHEELVERRILQDKAIGQCYRLTQELQYAIDVLPVDVDKYTRFAEMIEVEINLIKGWRKADNKFKRVASESAANFANVSNNGNANCNNASNANGVRPDFDAVAGSLLSVPQAKKGEAVLPNGKN